MAQQMTTPPERLTYERAREVFQRAYDLLNEHDPAHVPAVFTEDVVFVDEAPPETVRGHEDMRRFLASLWTAFPDFRFELVQGPYLADDGRRRRPRAGDRHDAGPARPARLPADRRPPGDRVRRLLRARG